MLAQVLLIPTESKKFIATAVAGMKEVQNVGIVALHPSSSTIFIVEELTGKPPDTEVWLCGANSPQGASGAVEVVPPAGGGASSDERAGLAAFPHTWVIENGELKSGIPLGDILDRMGENDVYIKGVNAVDLDKLFLTDEAFENDKELGPKQSRPAAVLPCTGAEWPEGGDFQRAQLLLINTEGIKVEEKES